MSIQDRKEKLRIWRHTHPDMMPYVVREERKIAQLERLATSKAQLKPKYYQSVLQSRESLDSKWPR